MLWRLVAAWIAVGAFIDSTAAATLTVSLQTGRTVNRTDGRSTTFNQTLDVGINTQYMDSWNEWNGGTYFWGMCTSWRCPMPEETRSLGDSSGGTAHRVLLKFSGLEEYLPPGVVVAGAQLQLAFVNWGSETVDVEACPMTRAWQHLKTGPSYKGTGWRYALYNTTSAIPVNWTQPGGWADCDPRYRFTFPAVAAGVGWSTRSLSLPPALVQAWAAAGGVSNHGLLLRAPNGTVSVAHALYKSIARRPALVVTYTSDAGVPAPQPPAEQVEVVSDGRTIWVDAGPAGNDTTGCGLKEWPYKSPKAALKEAFPGDVVYLRSGAYPGVVSITRPRITLASAPDEWAALVAATNDPVSSVNVLTIRDDATDGIIRNLELVGGFHYGIMFFADWENYGDLAERVAKGKSLKNWLLEGLRVHGTGSSNVKMTMKVANVVIRNCEMYDAGVRARTYGHNIEGTQAHNITIADNYLHDAPGAGVHLAGGSTGSAIVRNFIARTGFGANIGFATELEYMDPINNPGLFENRDALIANNIITSVRQAGINLWAASGARVLSNTLWQVQETAQNAILINSSTHIDAAGSPTASSANITILNNILVRSPGARAGPVLEIRTAGLDPTSPFIMAGNVYWDQREMSPAVFAWGHGVMLEDERTGTTFVGNATGWARHCTQVLGKPFCDIGSREGDPVLDATFTPLVCGLAAGGGQPLPGGVAPVTDDFHGRQRTVLDSGAVAANAYGTLKALPPVPEVFANIAPYIGAPLAPAHDREWPYDFWTERACKDLLVDPATGDDGQAFNYESNYAKPFKTIGAALLALNGCDRVLLKGGVTHKGPFGIYRPNVTIMTDPASFASAGRATISCSGMTDRACIIAGDGFYDGAAHVLLSNINIVASAWQGPCIQFNEGSGSGATAYWRFYVLDRSLGDRPDALRSVIEDMDVSGCGTHGIKLSTFVDDVTIRRVRITGVGITGIEMRNANRVLVTDCTIDSPGASGVIMGGGAAGNVVERNTILRYGDRGILIGSDNTEPMYMDYDAVRQGVNPLWHDNVGATVRNNLIMEGKGAGLALYGARGAVVVHNTLVNISREWHAGIIFNVSPKVIEAGKEVAPPNLNCTVANNVVIMHPASTTPLVESRTMGAGLPASNYTFGPAAGSCAVGGGSGRRLVGHGAEGGAGGSSAETVHLQGRQLQQASFAAAVVNMPGSVGRNPDGSCPTFPANNLWHLPVSNATVHPNSDSIKQFISGTGRRLHPDFGGGYGSGSTRILYGIPFITVDSTRNPSVMAAIDFLDYEDESDPGPYPFPPDAPVEGAYLGCSESTCGGDRHVVVVDNATCLLYETWRSKPPQPYGSGARWAASNGAVFNLSSNKLRPLGWTSGDAAGLPIMPGLIKFNETVVKGVIDHAIRFTVPVSRPAYALPATHFAAAGEWTDEAPWMGMRARLKASYNCSALLPIARVVCTALQTYGAILADNGSPWYLTGEATAQWEPYLLDIWDTTRGIAAIPSFEMEVLLSECICTNADCTAYGCGASSGATPDMGGIYEAVQDWTSVKMSGNIYVPAPGSSGRFVDRRPGSAGVDGDLDEWAARTGETCSQLVPNVAALALNPATWALAASSPAKDAVPLLPALAPDDFSNSEREAIGVGGSGRTDPGAVAAPGVPRTGALCAADPAEVLDFNDTSSIFRQRSTLDLLRAYAVLTACTIGPLVTHADGLVRLSRRLLGDTITFAAIRHTFFAHFCAGEDEPSLRPTIKMLSSNGIRPIVDYAAEDDVGSSGSEAPQSPTATAAGAAGESAAAEGATAVGGDAAGKPPGPLKPAREGAVGRVYDYADEVTCDRHVGVFLSAIDTVSKLGGAGFAAIKMTALGNPLLLERMSAALVEIRTLFTAGDTNADGYVSQPEFAALYGRLFPADPLERMQRAFQSFDTEGRGRVDAIRWLQRLQLEDMPGIVARVIAQGATTEEARGVMEAGLSAEEVGLAQALLERTRRLAVDAAARGVRLMIDAEHSYFQPGIDHTVKALQAEANRERPVVFNTYQCYLRGSYEALAEDLERARREGFKVGAKLVRGAYMQLERARAAQMRYPSPVWDTIHETHANYDRCVALMLQEVASHGAELMIASHNQASVEKAVQRMAEMGIPAQGGGVFYGQLLGMADHLTFGLGQNGYQAYKYVPYGPVPMVMPYLIRRAQENSSVLGAGVHKQLSMLRTELWRRLVGVRGGSGGKGGGAAVTGTA